MQYLCSTQYSNGQKIHKANPSLYQLDCSIDIISMTVVSTRVSHFPLLLVSQQMASYLQGGVFNQRLTTVPHYEHYITGEDHLYMLLVHRLIL